MSVTLGKKITCDRCKKTTFLKVLMEKEADGGYTRWTEFEKAEGWTYERFIGDLCPECSHEYDCLKEEFKRKQKEFEKMQKDVHLQSLNFSRL